MDGQNFNKLSSKIFNFHKIEIEERNEAPDSLVTLYFLRTKEVAVPWKPRIYI